ncbi:hypothetical protein E3P77_03484 [Wallemia ichthyophaga]|nr:hypothetical protein E3P77_03484 [Wallemia ichthyophaga]
MSKRQSAQQKHEKASNPVNSFDNYGYGHRAEDIQQIPSQYTHSYSHHHQEYAAFNSAYTNAAYFYPQPHPTQPIAQPVPINIPTQSYYPPPHPPPLAPNRSEPEPPTKRGRTNTYTGFLNKSYAHETNHKRHPQHKYQRTHAAIPQRPNFPANNQDQQLNSNKRSHNAMNSGNTNNRSTKRQAKAVRSTPVAGRDRTKNCHPDDKRRTLTDFRITAISIPSINWQWKQPDEEECKETDAAKENARLRLYFASPATVESKRGTIPLPPSHDEESADRSTDTSTHDPIDSKIREIEEKMDKTGILEPSSNRVSISYALNTRRIVLDAELIEHIIIKRKEGVVSMRMRLQRVDDPLSNMVESTSYLPESEKQIILSTHKAQLDADQADTMRICPGIIVEMLDSEKESYIPLSKQKHMLDVQDETVPPLQRLMATEQGERDGLPQLNEQSITIECALETKQPLTEARWVRNGNVEEWIEQTVSGAAFNPYKNFIAKQHHLSARVGWHGKIQVVDPDTPPTLVSRMSSWAKSCTLYSFKERNKFLATWFGLGENLLEKDVREGKRGKAEKQEREKEESEVGHQEVSQVADNGTDNGTDNDNYNVNGKINDMTKELEVLAREQDEDFTVKEKLDESQSKSDQSKSKLQPESDQESQSNPIFPTAEEYEISEAGKDAAIEILTRFIPLPVVSQSMKVILGSASRGDILDQVRKLPQNLINRSIEYAFKDYLRMTGKSRH